MTGRLAGPATGCGMRSRYMWRPCAVDPATVDLRIELTPEGVWPGTVARIGWLLAIEQPDAGGVAVDWVGQGPWESYADSSRAALHGRYRATVDELQTRYTRPQENGARRGVTRADLALTGGTLSIAVGEVSVGDRSVGGVELSARPWSEQALAAAAHPKELLPDGLLWLHLDAAQHGLGTAACGPGVLPAGRLHPAPAALHLRLTARAAT